MQRYSTIRWFGIPAALLSFAAALTPAFAEDISLKKGTDVKLEFASSLSSKTARPGDKVKFRVDEDVKAEGTVVIKSSTPVTGEVVKVDKRGRYGVNARIQLKMNPVKTITGKYVPLGFETKGQAIGGRTGEAAGATAAGAAVLGPIGLVAGYFIPGKTVNAKPGDKMTVQIDKDMIIKTQ